MSVYTLVREWAADKSAVSIKTLVLIWVGWAAIMFSYQSLSAARIRFERPDNVFSWATRLTNDATLGNNPYLIHPFMNHQVAWDSEYYLSIAVYGYGDPNVSHGVIEQTGEEIPQSYAFYPLYPFTIRAVSAPLRWLGVNPLSAAILAGTAISLVGTFVGMLALYDLARAQLGHNDGTRSVFYLVAFPSGFFLAQVYSEAMFIGLAFACLALLRRKLLFPAAALACLAVWTRAVGVLLIIPLLYTWMQELDWRITALRDWRVLAKGAALLAFPVGAYLIWNHFLGVSFHIVEENVYGRGLLMIFRSLNGWLQAFRSLFGSNPQTAVYYLIEIAATGLALVACLVMFNRYRPEALFSLGVWTITTFSGYPLSMLRYMLAVPVLFLFLAYLGRNAIFDRIWTMISIMLMALMTTMFTFDMWVG